MLDLNYSEQLKQDGVTILKNVISNEIIQKVKKSILAYTILLQTQIYQKINQ